MEPEDPGASAAHVPGAGCNPEQWLDEHGDCLYGYALARVRRQDVAEDLVQETLIAAFRSRERFQGRSTERSWLVGILKNKIVDHYRTLGREQNFTDLESLSDEFSGKFVEAGFWNHDLAPHDWKPASDEVAHREEFWQTMPLQAAFARGGRFHAAGDGGSGDG